MAWLVNKTDLAGIFGVSVTTVSKWMARGCPYEQAGSEKHFETVEVMEWLYGDRPSLQVMNRREAAAGSASGGRLDAEQERARKDKASADRGELELAVRRGELIEVTDAEAEWTRAVMAIRVAVLGMPARLAEEMAAITKLRQAKARLRTEAREILEELSEYEGADGNSEGDA